MVYIVLILLISNFFSIFSEPFGTVTQTHQLQLLSTSPSCSKAFSAHFNYSTDFQFLHFFQAFGDHSESFSLVYFKNSPEYFTWGDNPSAYSFDDISAAELGLTNISCSSEILFSYFFFLYCLFYGIHFQYS